MHTALAHTISPNSLVSQRECTMLAACDRQCARLRTCCLSPASFMTILCLSGAHTESAPNQCCRVGSRFFCACASSGALVALVYVHTPVQSMCLHSACQCTARAERGHLRATVCHRTGRDCCNTRRTAIARWGAQKAPNMQTELVMPCGQVLLSRPVDLQTFLKILLFCRGVHQSSFTACSATSSHVIRPASCARRATRWSTGPAVRAWQLQTVAS